MTLRARLVLVLGSLVALLLGAEWWLVRTLTRELDQEVDVVALTVGSSMLSLFVGPEGADPTPLLGVAVPGTGVGPEDAPIVFAPATLGPDPARLGFPSRAEFEVQRGTSHPMTAHGAAFEGDLEVIVLDSEPQHVAAESPRPAMGRWTSTARVALRVGSHSTAIPLELEGAPFALARAHEALRELGAAGGTERITRIESRVVDTESAHGPVSEYWVTAQARADVQRATETHRGEAGGGGAPGAPPDASVAELEFGPTRGPAAEAPRMRIPVPRGGLDRAVDTFLSQLLLGSIALFAVGLGAIAWVAHRVTRPLRSLADAAARVGGGDLGAVVAVDGDREVAATLRAFNGMSERLAALDLEARTLRERQHLGELGDVARGLAHALRNPLHTLGLAVDVLASGRREAVDTALAARTQIQRIDGALEGFLTLAGAGGARERVALDDLARDVALELAQSTSPTAVRVLAEAGPTPVACVPAELRAVVHALVVNAAEAAPGEPVVVRVEPLDGGARARLEVLDRGPGLAPDVRAKLFTPHVTTKAHGTGMGLYLAERIARTRYGGSLALHERPGGGVRAVLEVAADVHGSAPRASSGDVAEAHA